MLKIGKNLGSFENLKENPTPSCINRREYSRLQWLPCIRANCGIFWYLLKNDKVIFYLKLMVKELFTNKPKFHLVEMCAKLFFLYIFILFETETIQ